MKIKEYFSKMKNIEEKLLNFLDQEDQGEENYENFIHIITDENILTNQYDFKIILYLINKISTNHYHFPKFYEKIEQILKTIKEKIKQFFSNDEIFKIFNSNKLILLFLIEEQIFIIDQSISNEMMADKYKQKRYPEYFSFEIKPFIEEKREKSHQNELELNFYEKINEILKEDFEKFNEKRKNGQNDGYLYKIIQNDMIDEFITYVNQNFYSLNSYVEKSIFETNNFLLKQDETTLIEYTAFYGSNQIFKYLYKNGAEMSPRLWLYAIHGCDEEIIHILEENKIININEEEEESYDLESDEYYEHKSITYKNCIIESLKCHHHHITNYILANFLKNEEFTNADMFSYCIKYYNFVCLNIKKININYMFVYACIYDFFRIVEFSISNIQFDINDKLTLNNDDGNICF